MPQDFDDDEDALEPGEGRARRLDAPVENSEETPLLPHAGTGKTNTVNYIKVTRIDGPPGERGYKGRLPSDASIEELARRYGNGCYKLEGCNYKHKVIASESDVEVSVPEYESNSQASDPAALGGASAMLHALGMLKAMAERHETQSQSTATEAQGNVTAMAERTVEMMRDFTSASRDSERETHQTAVTQMQGFFAAMLQMTQTNHAQMMQLMQASQERERERQTPPTDPMQMMELFMQGLQLGHTMGDGEGDEAWVKALKEGGTMLSSLAQLATSSSRPEQATRLLSAGAGRALPAPKQGATVAANGSKPGVADSGRPRRRKLPFSTNEVRGLARLRAQLRKRGVSFDDYIAQSVEHFETVPDSEMFAENDGPDGSGDAATESEDTTPSPRGPAGPDDA